MATSKTLQKPQILGITASSIRIKHPYLLDRPNTRLAAQMAAAATAMSVYDNNGFADNDWFIVGQPGDAQTEENDVNGAVTRGQSMTVTNTQKFGHALDAPVTLIYERGIKIYGASSDGGSGTLIASVDALTTPIADAVMIQWDKPYTEYTFISTDTAYNYYYVKFTDGTTDSSASDYIPATGHPYNAAMTLIEQALDSSNTAVDGIKFTYDMLTNWVQDWQMEVSQFTYKDSQTNKAVKKDWNHEIVEDLTTITLSQNEDQYDLETLLTADLKYIDSGRAVIAVQIGDKTPLVYYELDEFIRYMYGKHRTEIATQAGIGDTTMTVDSTAGFPTDGGTVTVEGDSITYTGVTSTTFTGIPASGTGSITAVHEVNDAVWNNNPQAVPQIYTMIRGKLRFNCPPDETVDGFPLKLRYYRKLERITEVSDTTVIPFTNTAIKYLKMRIEERKGNNEVAAKHQADFYDALFQNAMADSQPLSQSYTRFFFDDPDDEMRWTSRFND